MDDSSCGAADNYLLAPLITENTDLLDLRQYLLHVEKKRQGITNYTCYKKQIYSLQTYQHSNRNTNVYGLKNPSDEEAS